MEVTAFTRLDALSAGYTDNEIAAQVRTGRWVRLRRGSFVTADSVPSTAEHRHVVRVRAALTKLEPGSIVSHQSALLLHDLPLWGAPLAEVHVTRLDAGSARLRGGVHSHRRSLTEADVTTVDGLRATTAERSLLDLACEAGFESAVCSMDAALRRDIVTPKSLSAALARFPRCRGVGQARRAVGFATGHSESVGESRLRVAVHELALPTPELQHEFRDARGALVGRVDFWWPIQRTIVEFDGLVKYRGTMGAPVEVLVAEKRREDALRALTGASVVRVVWSELADRAELGRTLRWSLGLTR